MAYAALVCLTNTLKLCLRDLDQPTSVHHKKQQHESLHEKATILVEFLENSSQQTREIVEAKIRDTAYEAEDIVEAEILDNLDELIAQFDIIIQEVKKMEEICHEEDPRSRKSSSAAPSKPVSSDQTIVVGSEEKMREIKDQLMGLQSELEVIPIVGMGGIGKTTLAETLYNDPDTLSHFATRGWVTVSQTYSVPRILRAILESMGMLTDQLRQEENDVLLSEHVYRILMKSARYLIVLDDVWDINVWDSIARVFPKGDNGSRIIITTRLKDVAVYASCSSPPHQMQLMSEEEACNLLREKVFGEEHCPSELNKSGRRIARHCKGLPLAIVVVGGLLSNFGRSPEEWEIFTDKLINSVSTLSYDDDDDQCLGILSLSYNHLPQHLKACFLYMGAFPEDDEISVSRLIKLWVAEGFLKEETSRNFEEVAEENLEELVHRSLVMVRKKQLNGKTKTCSIHDQLRKLCLKEAEKENFVCWVDKPEIQVSDRMRRVGFHSSKLIRDPVDLPCSRSVLFSDFIPSAIHYLLPSLRLLHVLDLGGFREFDFENDPVEFGELIHLRYLRLPYLFYFPASITKCGNLQTLIFPWDIQRNCINDFEIWKMPRLRHFKGGRIGSLSFPIHLRSVLGNLQTLHSIEASLCTKEVLQGFPNLRKLEIHFTTWENQALCINNLACSPKLEVLICHTIFYVERHTRFIENLAFPETLQKLTLVGEMFFWEEMRIIGSLPNLQVLKLVHGAFFRANVG